VAQPGGSLQLRLLLTQAKPIVTARAQLDFGAFLAVRGVVFPGNPDAAGTAVVSSSGRITLRAVSPSGTFGLVPGAPIVAVSLGVPATTPVGTGGPLSLDALGSWWIDPLGQPYPQDVRQGAFSVVPAAVSIADVVPGGGLLPAGTTLRIIGVGFQPGALVEVDGVPVASTTFVDPEHLEAIIAATAQLDGRRVRVKNPDRTRAPYYSYLRAASLGSSARPLLDATEPVFPVQPLSGAIFTAPSPAPGRFFGIALQNPQPTSSVVSIELLSTTGAVVASTSLTLPARTEISREISELLSGVSPASASTVVIKAVPAVQMLGLLGDETEASVAPLLPLLSVP
jgi:hypothetical protein